ncbi:hypothetical protein [Salsuginibacillus kocurii]|uniref:hypothetical protein n=1 Tax=Salsuginibacillus kocurii TaxID=427078 RepID=UPI000381E6F4|nr:hypothetical protein [Salsuginibacillus kocurii]
MWLANHKGMAGKATNYVAVSFSFWKQLLNSQTDSCAQARHLTHTDLDLMILLHKICNTNGYIKEVTRHQVVQAAAEWFERPPGRTQLYVSLEKFVQLGLITIKRNEYTGKDTICLHHFKKEDGNLERYVILHPIVFSGAFHALTLAARKVYLLTAMQQGENDFIFRRLKGEASIMTLLNKNQPNQVRSVLNELKGANKEKIDYLKTATISSNHRGAENVYLALSPAFLPKLERGAEVRAPLSPPLRYPKKAKFIRNVLNELGIGELEQELHLLIETMKALGYRVIRQILRTVQIFIKQHGSFPKNLAHFIKKEARLAREKRILDLAHNAGIADYIAYKQEQREERYFEFTNRFSWYSERAISKMFKKAAKYVKDAFPAPGRFPIERYHYSESLTSEPNVQLARQKAYATKLDPVFYQELEAHMLEFKWPYMEPAAAAHWLLKRTEEEIHAVTVHEAPMKLEDFILFEVAETWEI